MQLVEGKATSRYLWLIPQYYYDSLQTFLGRVYSSLEWGLKSPPKPHAFTSLPLQSFAFPPRFNINHFINAILPILIILCVPTIIAQTYGLLPEMVNNATVHNASLTSYVLEAYRRVAQASQTINMVGGDQTIHITDRAVIDQIITVASGGAQVPSLTCDPSPVVPATIITPITSTTTETLAHTVTVSVAPTVTVTVAPTALLPQTGIPPMPSMPRFLPIFYLLSGGAMIADSYRDIVCNVFVLRPAVQTCRLLVETSVIVVPGVTGAATVGVQPQDNTGMYIALAASAIALLTAIAFRQHIGQESIERVLGYFINYDAGVAIAEGTGTVVYAYYRIRLGEDPANVTSDTVTNLTNLTSKRGPHK